ncbi:acyl-CoA dehydrogenase family protein [Bradyrhizobium sp. LHD-71]|uniref:acyl-CoA dehydrogenase family protein n=1 Tax=Bradyrhizobium sp. LHD-71 TaxID=3072141 RepID=UPI00280EF365|nr:acyl-CoA dehydrogenase family protein [Bradyrhizobium sp. LHD-71]MDQ8730172.1 acyl-CoA dehydrogenase family protein [Bradyrhizobium sp. LHD-71]
MDLTYGPELEAFRNEVRAFIASHRHKVPPAQSVASRHTPETLAWQALLLQHGYAARTIPKQYGGFGAASDPLKTRIIAEEFAEAGVPPALAGIGISMLVPTLLEKGNEEQRQRWIARTLRGDVEWCQGYSEPNAGSDLASLQTRAVVDGDHFVINGQKIWTSRARYADMMFCLVRTEPDKPKHLGISYLLISMKTPGIEVRPLKTMTGRAEFNEVFFTDVRVPVTQIVGSRGEGWAVANATLKHERGMLGDPNASRRRLTMLAKLMQEEAVDGHRPIDEPVLRDRLMQLEGRLLAMQFTGMRNETAAAKKESPGLAGMIMKLQGCELNHQLSTLAIDALGELGVLYDDSPYLRAHGSWQSSSMFELGLIIGGGTAQIQKNIIAERGLDMPREPKVVSD